MLQNETHVIMQLFLEYVTRKRNWMHESDIADTEVTSQQKAFLIADTDARLPRSNIVKISAGLVKLTSMASSSGDVTLWAHKLATLVYLWPKTSGFMFVAFVF